MIEPRNHFETADDGVTDLQEKILGFLEDQTPFPSIINDQVSHLVRFYEEVMQDYRGDYHFAKDLAAQLADMSVAINKKLVGYGP